MAERAVASPNEPARIVLDAAPRAAAEGAGTFSLALTPTEVAAGEAFLVSVVAEAADGTRREIASLSFFPPPREGVTRRFPLDLARLPASTGPITLEIGLVAVEGELEATRLRVGEE
ncbi:hypothetical protein [Salinarimonas ramus]|uniref:Uncharacterized protein n=1 Tax=Salinarimonas ramus TaxID=690164 RepID=A0A917V6K1_9HYPH|nr:hypothetical protein [Salinarimonas ramus]GGK44748.1 hypothetical protein GCM10011322_34890 [Salinarimonas ramus]